MSIIFTHTFSLSSIMDAVPRPQRCPFKSVIDKDIDAGRLEDLNPLVEELSGYKTVTLTPPPRAPHLVLVHYLHI